MKNKDQIREFIEQILKLKALKGEDWKVRPPEIIRDVWLIINRISGLDDPLKKIKKEQNDAALKIYSSAKRFVSESYDPFLEALKFSIAGNSIDIITGETKKPKKEIIKRLQESVIKQKNIKGLKERLNKARRLVYLGDNCGEIVFDRLFIETILDNYDIEITFVTRGFPVANDATLSDALYVGMDKVVRVIDNGIRNPLAGTMLKKISPELKRLIDESDLIISKGGGNHNLLDEESRLKGKISFLFQVKCEPYTTIHRVPLGSLVVDNF
jgi:uncharacterized protein with ATP-grasp and redox domains